MNAAVVAKSNDEIYEKLNLLINDKELIVRITRKKLGKLRQKDLFDRVNISDVT